MESTGIHKSSTPLTSYVKADEYHEIYPNSPQGHLPIGNADQPLRSLTQDRTGTIKNMILCKEGNCLISACKSELKFWDFMPAYKHTQRFDYRTDVSVKHVQIEREFRKNTPIAISVNMTN